MADGDFYKAFKANMDAMGLPAPASLFGTLTAAIATTQTIASAIGKYGYDMPISAFLTVPFAAGGTAMAAGFAEIATVLGAVSASFYLGACIGSLVGAAIDTYGAPIIGQLSTWLRNMSTVMDESVADFMDEMIDEYPDLAAMRESSTQVRAMA